MTRLLRKRFMKGFFVVWLCAGAPIQAQSTPEMREILTRLQKLEEANHALTDEIHALRQELAAARPPSTEATEEQISVQNARVEDLAQSKVEASQKLPLRITGMALFNAYKNGRFNGGVENPILASLSPGDATGGGTLRQSVFGLEYQSPQSVLGAKISGAISIDFFGGSASSLNHLMRLRTATVSLDWEKTSILVGQDRPIISPRDPNSLAQVGVSPLSGAGNLWLWQPQIRVEHRFDFGSNFGLRAQVGVIQTRELGAEDNGYTQYVPPPTGAPVPVEQAKPGIEGRLELWRRWGEDRRVEMASGFHENPSSLAGVSIPSRIYSADWFIKPVPHFEFSGLFFSGQNIANLGALPQGFTIEPYGNASVVHSLGGWAQIRIPLTARLAFDFYGGQQNDRRSDLQFGNIGRNFAYAANVMYRIAPNVIVSLESGQLRTSYIRFGNWLNNHYDLAIAYLF
jgi:hypothetical protein